jgi:hypothetical protein
MSNGILEPTSTKIRLLIWVALGFHSADTLITVIPLHLGDHQIDPRGRGSPS